MCRRPRATVPPWALLLLLLCHGWGAAGLKRRDAPAASPAQTSAAERTWTRQAIRCILARATHDFDKVFRRWPGGAKVAWPRGQKTCAVVSSSGVLAEHKHGRAIDSAARIYRFNDAPRGGRSDLKVPRGWKPFRPLAGTGGEAKGWEHLIDFTDMVGKRDDVRVVNDIFPYKYVAGWRPYAEPAVYLVVNLSWATPSAPPPELERFARLTRAAVYSLDPKFVRRAEEAMHEIFEPAWWGELGQSQKGARRPLGSPSSGFLASLLALKLCREVRLYGGAVTPRGLHARYHYYPSDENSMIGNANGMNDHQDFKAEKFMFRLLATNPDLDQTDVAKVKGVHKIWEECEHAYTTANASDGKAALPRLPIPTDVWRREFES